MLIWNSSKLTTAGKALLAKAQAGKATIKITKAQTGSGSYASGEAVDTRTALKAPQQTFPISDHADQQRQHARAKNCNLEQNRRYRTKKWI